MTHLHTPRDVFGPMVEGLDTPWGADWLDLADAWHDAVYLDELIGRDKPIKPILCNPDFFNASGMRVHNATWRQPMPTHIAQLDMGVCYRTKEPADRYTLLRCFSSKLACAVSLPHLPEVLTSAEAREEGFGTIVSLGLGNQALEGATSLFQMGIADALDENIATGVTRVVTAAVKQAEQANKPIVIGDIAKIKGDPLRKLAAYAHRAYAAPHQRVLNLKHAFDYITACSDTNIGNILLTRLPGSTHEILFVDTQPDTYMHGFDARFFQEVPKCTGKSGMDAAQAFARAMEEPFTEMAQRMTDDVIDETAEKFMRKLQRADRDVIRTHVAATKDRRTRAVDVARRFAMK